MVNLSQRMVWALLFAFIINWSYAASWYMPGINSSAAFLNGNVVSIGYTHSYLCAPSITSAYPNISIAIANITQCVTVTPTNVVEAFPIWAIVPAYAGFSIYGFQQWNSTHEGFATFQGNAIITDCGAGGSASACGETPAYMYTTKSHLYEQAYGVFNGINKMPQGLLPFPAHNYITLTGYGGTPTALYAIFVMVFDPNIFPNATTGRCMQVAPSNLTNATANCLTSFTALKNAIATRNAYIPQINAGNRLWALESNSTLQAAIVLNSNITGTSNTMYPNSNIYLYVQTNDTNYYKFRPTPANAANAEVWIIVFGFIASIFIAINVYWLYNKLKERRVI